MKVEVYSIPNCPYCVKAKNSLKEHGMDYSEYTVDNISYTRDDIQKRVDSLGLDVEIRTVPQIFIDDGYIGGYAELMNHFKW